MVKTLNQEAPGVIRRSNGKASKFSKMVKLVNDKAAKQVGRKKMVENVKQAGPKNDSNGKKR